MRQVNVRQILRKTNKAPSPEYVCTEYVASVLMHTIRVGRGLPRQEKFKYNRNFEVLWNLPQSGQVKI